MIQANKQNLIVLYILVHKEWPSQLNTRASASTEVGNIWPSIYYCLVQCWGITGVAINKNNKGYTFSTCIYPLHPAASCAAQKLASESPSLLKQNMRAHGSRQWLGIADYPPSSSVDRRMNFIIRKTLWDPTHCLQFHKETTKGIQSRSHFQDAPFSEMLF